MTAARRSGHADRGVNAYIVAVAVAALIVGWVAWCSDHEVDGLTLLLLSGLGVLSFQLREPDVGSRVGFSFLSVILLASATFVGPFGAWLVGISSVAVDRRQLRWSQTLFNMAMTGIVGATGALAYAAVGGQREGLESLRGMTALTLDVGLPLIVADLVQCLTNALLLSGVMHLHQRIPFVALVRRFLETSGLAYVGYGIIAFLFVVVWFPGKLGPSSAVLILAPLLAARWAFIQYGDELRAHTRTLDTLVTALGTKEPAAVERSRRAARLAEWIAEDLGLGPHQIGVVRQIGTLHEIGHIAVPARTLRRPPGELSPQERRLVDSHGLLGAQVIEGIDFLDAARPGIRHQHERFDGRGVPGALVGPDIPLTARITAVVARFTALTSGEGALTPSEALDELSRDVGRFDPEVLATLGHVLAKQEWPPPGEAAT